MSRSRAAVTAALLLCASIALAGCSSANPSDDDARDTAGSHAAEPKASSTPSSSATAEAAASGKVSVTAQKIVDDQMGHEVQADALVRDFPWTDEQSGLADTDDEQVLVHVSATAGSKYYSSVGCDSIKVVAHGQTESWAAQDTSLVVEDAMGDAGYPKLEDVDAGKSGDGWCAYAVSDPTGDFDLEYMRSAAASNDGTQITAKDFFEPLTLGS